MAKRTVRQAVLTKVNEALGTNVQDIVQLGDAYKRYFFLY